MSRQLSLFGFFTFGPCLALAACGQVRAAEGRQGDNRPAAADSGTASNGDRPAVVPTAAPASEQSLDPRMLAALKRASVYIRIKKSGGEGSGSGFVIWSKDRRALVATNHHVVGPYLPADAPPFVADTLTPRLVADMLNLARITVVLDSDSKRERSAKGQVIASDPEADLAILEITDVGDLPAPIEHAKPLEPWETMAVYTFGFPLGHVLATSKESNPSVTVGKASVSSLRFDGDGQLHTVQIDGNLNPGNSGGPVVDVHGKLVGIAVAKIQNADGIAFAVPAAKLAAVLAGRLGKSRLTRVTPAGAAAPTDTISVQVDVGLIDPFHQLGEVTLTYVPVDQLKAKSETIKDLATEPAHKQLRLKTESLLASGQFTLPSGELPRVAVQFATKRGDSVQRTAVEVLPVSTQKPLGIQAPKPLVRGQPGQPGQHVPMHPFGQAPHPDETLIRGGSMRDTAFRDTAPEGGYLIGFEIRRGAFVRKEVIAALRPIFRVGEKEVLGQQHGNSGQPPVKVVAKPGYALGSITVRWSLMIVGFSCKFIRIKGDKLDPDDFYESEWFGGTEIGGEPTVLEGGGRFVTGIIGKEGGRLGCSGIGLLFRPAAAVSTPKDK